MLMRFDPFRDIDRAFEQAFGADRQSSMPMDAYRHGDRLIINVDLPGIDPSSIDVSVEQNVVTISAERHWQPVEGDDLVVNERRQGTFKRQLFLGNTLDTEAIDARYDNGVLSLTIPVSEKAKARKVEIGNGKAKEAITASAS